jgi:3-hydroxyisobutyrate dehydrogenase
MVSFLGTGLLGANFTRALLKRGEKVSVWNRTTSKAKMLQQYGAAAFEELPAAVSGAERVHLTLSDDQVVDEVLAKASSGFSKGIVIVDHSTTSVNGAIKRSEEWGKKGIYYIHAPVFMGPPSALEGTGIMLVSGDQQVIARIEGELSKMTGKLWNLGQDPGKAAAVKLLGNLFHISLTGGIADMLTLANSLNVPSAELGPLIELLNPGNVAQARLRKITSNTFDEPSWELKMARKDARLMMEQVAATGHKLMVVPAVAEKMDKSIRKGHGDEDWTILAVEEERL